MTTENGNISTASLEMVKWELGGIREFYEQRMNAEIPPLREEVERIGSQLLKLQDARRQGEKRSLLQQAGVGERARVLSASTRAWTTWTWPAPAACCRRR